MSAKFEITIEKIQEIAASLSKMVSLQQQKIETSELANKEMFSHLMNRISDHTSDIKDIYNKIDNINKDLMQKMNETEKRILDQLSEMQENNETGDKSISSRLREIELWKYGIMGAIGFAGYLIGIWPKILPILS